MNGMNMNNMNMNMNVNAMMQNMNMRARTNAANGMPMNNMNGMDMQNGAGYPMANIQQQQHFTGMPGQQQQQQGGQQLPQQPQQPQPQQQPPPPQQQQPHQQQHQFMVQGMTPQFAVQHPQSIPQGQPQPQPQPQQSQPTPQQAPQQHPQQQSQGQYQDVQYNAQPGQVPSSIMMMSQPKSAGPTPSSGPNASTANPGAQATTPAPTAAHAPGSATTSQPPPTQRIPMVAGRPVIRDGATTASAAAISMGMNANANANAVMNYRRHVTNTETLKFLDFCELVGVRSESTKNILYWKKIITEYFSENGVLRYAVKAGADSRQFEFSVPIIPRFFFSIIQSGVTRIEIQPGMLRTQVLPNGTTYLESPRCCFTHHYADGSYVNIHGSMKGILNQELRIDWLDFQTHVFIPGVEWPSLEKLLSDESKMKDVLSMLNESGESPKSNGTKGEEKSVDPKKLKVLQKFRSNFQVFHSMSNFGLQESVMRVMQVSDVMAHLRSLMTFSISSSNTGPLHALDEFVARNQKRDDSPTKKGTTAAGTSSSNNTSNAVPTTTAASNATGNGTSTANNSATASAQKKSEPVSQKNSPMPDASPHTKVVTLDMSQSTLTKRRRKSTVGELSPKSVGSPNLKPKVTKKSKR